MFVTVPSAYQQKSKASENVKVRAGRQAPCRWPLRSVGCGIRVTEEDNLYRAVLLMRGSL